MVSCPAAVGTRWWCDPTAYGLRSTASPEVGTRSSADSAGATNVTTTTIQAGVQLVKWSAKTRSSQSVSRQRCRLRRMRQRVRRTRTRHWQILLNAELYSDVQHQAQMQPTAIFSDTDEVLDDASPRERAATDVLKPTVMPLPQQPNLESPEDLKPVD